MMAPTSPLFSYRRHWAHRFGTAPFLPMSQDEMDALGWDACDVVLVTGDAYVDHPASAIGMVKLSDCVRSLVISTAVKATSYLPALVPDLRRRD